MSVNLLENSNVFKKVDMRKRKSKINYIKIILNMILILLLCGVVYQIVINFIANETLNSKTNYATVNDKRLDYLLEGSGDYTIIFDGAIGGTLWGWSPVVEAIGDDAYTFVYNRYGYGYSSTTSELSIEQQAEDLKILLRKAGAPEPYILVGEEYGSLVLSSFAEKFKESVAGVMLINPLNEGYLNSGEFVKDNSMLRVRRNIEKAGSYFGLTALLSEINLDVNIENFKLGLTDENLEEFEMQRIRTNYTGAVLNEMNMLAEGNIDIYQDNIFVDIPYYILSSDENEVINNLGSSNLTKIITTENNEKFLAVVEADKIVELLRLLIDDIEDMN